MTSSSDSSASPPIGEVYRRSLRANVAAACTQVGWDAADKVAVESLVELLQSYITEVARSTQLFCEHSGRTNPTYCDVLIALAHAGFPVASLTDYLDKVRNEPVAAVSTNLESNSSPMILQVGVKRKFPNYIPDTFNYPQLPDPHTYIRTTTGVQPETDYVVLRERSASGKRNVERALTQFVARTSHSLPLFPSSNGESAYSLIDTDPSPDSYLESLLPSQEDMIRLREYEQEEVKPEGDDSVPKNEDKEVKQEEPDLSSPRSRGRRDFNKTDTSRNNPNNPFLRPVKRLRQQRKKPRRG